MPWVLADPDASEPFAGLPGVEALQLMPWREALHAVHRPTTHAALHAGRRQLAFQVRARQCS